MKFQEFMDKSELMGLHRQYQAIFSPLTKELKVQGLNLNESLILLSLFFENERDVTPSLLQTTLGIPKDQISHSLKKLEESGLVRAYPFQGDRRKKRLKLSTKAKNLASRLVGLFDESEQRLESQFL